MHNTSSVKVDELQQLKTTSGSAPVIQEQKSEAIIDPNRAVEDWKKDQVIYLFINYFLFLTIKFRY